jgi:CspA family cold shock protein
MTVAAAVAAVVFAADVEAEAVLPSDLASAIFKRSQRFTLSKGDFIAMPTGTVKWFNPSKGYGFIINDEGGELYVHLESIKGGAGKRLKEGQRVTFDVARTARGPQATNVTLTGEIVEVPKTERRPRPSTPRERQPQEAAPTKPQKPPKDFLKWRIGAS